MYISHIFKLLLLLLLQSPHHPPLDPTMRRALPKPPPTQHLHRSTLCLRTWIPSRIMPWLSVRISTMRSVFRIKTSTKTMPRMHFQISWFRYIRYATMPISRLVWQWPVNIFWASVWAPARIRDSYIFKASKLI